MSGADRFRDNGTQAGDVEGFSNYGDRAGLGAAQPSFVNAAGHEHERIAIAALAQAPDQRWPVDVGHRDIADDEVPALALGGDERLVAVGSLAYDMPLAR